MPQWMQAKGVKLRGPAYAEDIAAEFYAV